MSQKGNGTQNTQSAKVLQLGFNISVSGDSGTDFQIVLDDKGQKSVKPCEKLLQLQSSDALELQDSNQIELPKYEIEQTENMLHHVKSTGATPEQRTTKNYNSCESPKITENENLNTESSIINEIKNTMEHFEKFSDHIKEIPRLKNHPIATSTPFSNKQNSKSETNLIYPEYRPRRFAHLYDFQPKKEYFRGSIKPLPPDLYLKPLPGENFYKRGIVTRFCDLETYRHYGSAESLNKSSSVCTKSKYDIERYESTNILSEVPSGILKKPDNESGDKQSTSSADSIKDIKIYQSGGILIMQNFKENMDVAEKKEISEFSAKLIENCNKLKEEINNGLPNIEEKILITNSCDEYKSPGKMVQFDLSGFTNQKSKSFDSSSNPTKDDSSSAKIESSESLSDCMKNRDTSPQETFQSQDFPSISTQENDSMISNHHGMSPTFNTSGKKLEWDSGADVGYLNLDLSKENLSTIERIVLKGLSSDGLSEKKVIYEKKTEQNQVNRSKFILERMPSELVIEEIVDDKKKLEDGSKISINVDHEKEEEKSIKLNQKKLNAKGKEILKEKVKEVLSTEVSKDEKNFNSEEFKINKEKAVKEVSKNEKLLDNIKPKRSDIKSFDKSINVNTLFLNADGTVHSNRHSNRTESNRQNESPKFKFSRLSPKVKKLKKKKISSQRINFRDPLKEKIDTIIDIAKYSGTNNEKSVEMGIPKKIHRKVEANPELNEVELSRDLDEIIIDQRFKIKHNVPIGRESNKETPVIITSENVEHKNENKSKSRPISASSGSNNTVFQNTNGQEEIKKKKAAEPSKFTDQKIQTNEFNVKSVGTQAFASQKSSDCDFKTHKNDKALEFSKAEKGVTMTSKNIQAFGLNSSLPKQLAHPKEANFIESQNTKSTQYFGGPINSLPNYHSGLVTKPGESCGHMQKVLKAKKNIETEIIHLLEENEKNKIAKDDFAKKSDSKQNIRRRSEFLENKENLVMEKTVNTKNSQSSTSQKSTKENENNKEPSELNNNLKNSDEFDKAKENVERKILSIESSECCRITDDISSKVLTSEVLREHGDSIDRNIIKEKYFQSQLIEIEKREMVSKSTSMERQYESEKKENIKNSNTVGCQYSPQSKENKSEEEFKNKSDTLKIKITKRSRQKKMFEQNGSSQNIMGKNCFENLKNANQDEDFGICDSLPSSTQTSHSLIPGMHDLDCNNKSGVGRARSFEYLPGHIYESNGNLRENLPNDTEQNILTCSSSGSSNSDVAQHSVGNGLTDSEGRKTLVLENSTESSCDSNPLKILDENLTQLNLVVSKLWEKDIQIQSVTQSLMVNLCKNNGSGDCSQHLGSATDTSRTEVNPNEKTLSGYEENKGSGDASSEIKLVKTKNENKNNEISIGCQTEEKTSLSDPEKIYEEKKIMEKRIIYEKENQIKWIEKEIYHLNLLRELLETQNYASQSKKSQSPTTTAKSEEEYQKNILAEVHPQPVTPVYGCVISLLDNISPGRSQSISEKENLPNHVKENENYSTIHKEENKNYSRAFEGINYDVAASANGNAKNFRQRIMLPVGVQVTLKNKDFKKHCTSNKNFRESSSIEEQSQSSSSTSQELDNIMKFSKPSKPQKCLQSDVNTQFPSLRKSPFILPSTSVQTDFHPNIRCTRCVQDNCVCLNLSDKSYESKSNSLKSDHKSSENRRVHKLIFNQNNGHNIENNIASNNESCAASKIDSCSENSEANRSDTSGNFAATKTCQRNICCKCENCPKKKVSKISKSDIPCCSSCQSKIYLNCEKNHEESECCCSKVQVQRSSNCACHIIKIHGSKCSSTANALCSCRRRIAVKKTENQFCQTDDVTSVIKDLAFNSEIEKASEVPQTVYPSQTKILENKNSVVEKFSCKPKISNEKEHPIKLSLQEENELEKKTTEKAVSTEMETPTPVTICNCQKKKAKKEDHPRHYFLKIEETEIEESNESVERRKSLEVITVTVPVKKANKAKIYGNKFRQTYQSRSCSMESFNDLQADNCKCCEACISRKVKKNFKTRTNEHQNKRKTEKPESPKRPAKYLPKPTMSNSLEDMDENSNVDNYRYEALNRQSSSSQESYKYKSNTEYKRPDSSYFDRAMNSSDYSKEGVQNIPCRDIPSEYDSHKEEQKHRKKKYYFECKKNKFYQDEREYEKQQKTSEYDKHCFDEDGQFKIGEKSEFEYRPQKFYRENGFYESDYYNYNKKEFMTKSELLKEKKKRQFHQPSLQECLASNRPDFYSSAECRRRIISERAKERVKKHNNRMDCLIDLIHQCSDQVKNGSLESKRIFTTSQMREQTMKRYKKLPEVTGKIADQKKKEEYRTNKLIADIYAKKLQLEALKGHINLSNSVSVLSTI